MILQVLTWNWNTTGDKNSVDEIKSGYQVIKTVTWLDLTLADYIIVRITSNIPWTPEHIKDISKLQQQQQQ